jgi:hypothetical protein
VEEWSRKRKRRSILGGGVREGGGVGKRGRQICILRITFCPLSTGIEDNTLERGSDVL